MTFAITGTNSASYIVPEAVELYFVDPTTGTFTIKPVATSLSGASSVSL